MSLPVLWMGSVGAGAKRIGQLIRIAARSRVFRPARIDVLLDSLCSQHALVTVRVPASGARFSSSIVDVSDMQRRFWLAGLQPPTTDGPLEAHTQVTISGQMDSYHLQFETSVTGVEARDGVWCYELAAPRWVRQNHRRTYPRLVTGRDITVLLVDRAANLLQGEVRDISLGGISARIMGAAPDGLNRGDRLASCTLRLPAQKIVQCGLEVRHVHSECESAELTLGGRFVNLSRRQRHLLTAYLSELQAA